MSRVWTKCVSEWNDKLGRYVTVQSESAWHEYDGPKAEAKGDNTAKQAEQQQMQFSQQMMGVFNEQFKRQNDVLDYLKGKVQPIIDAGGKGYSDEALAAMRTGATDNLSASYQNAQKALQAKQFSTGGRDLPSGVNEQLNSSLFASEAADKAGAQNEITLKNEDLKQQNYWNAMNVLSGNAAMYNPNSYANTAVSGGNAVAGLSQAVTASKQSGLMGAIGGAVGGVFGGAGQAGGFGKLFCWVAAATFNGWLDPRTIAVRNYLRDDFGQTFYGKPVIWLYCKIGRQVAEHKTLVKMLKPLMTLALKKARQ